MRAGRDDGLSTLRQAAGQVVDLLAAADYQAVEDLADGRRLSADELERAVAVSGSPLSPLPEGALELRLQDRADGDPAVEVTDLRVL